MPTTDPPPRELGDILATRNVEIFHLVLQTHVFAYREPDTLPAAAGCHGCSWIHPVADRETARRLHTLHLIEVLQANWKAVDIMAGDGYENLGTKHVIRCIRCDTTFLGDTPQDAEQAYQRHEDQLRRIDKAQRAWARTGNSDPLVRIRNSHEPRERRPNDNSDSSPGADHAPFPTQKSPQPAPVLGTRLEQRHLRFDAV
ncbi:hypothetical protein [Mycobacterium sp.]|uniref:hypothetical protein n=1 Tax=Mycobacterium sp. TaxID=1785 RepID=UPI0025CC1569|nr:hypothetical protein [Mycobacterium sp.]